MIKLAIRTIKDTRHQKTKYYPAATYSGTIGREAICEQISGRTTFAQADVLSTLCALEEIIAQKLQNGGIVRLGSLGSFRTSLRATEGVDEKEAVTTKNIKSVHVVFTPSASLNTRLQDNVQYSLK